MLAIHTPRFLPSASLSSLSPLIIGYSWTTLLLAFFWTTVSGQLCPLREHLVCNPDTPKWACLCAMSLHESPPPYPSCGHDGGKPEAVAIRLRITGASNNAGVPQSSLRQRGVKNSNNNNREPSNSVIFPERQLRRQLAAILGTEQRNILFLRFRCPQAANDSTDEEDFNNHTNGNKNQRGIDSSAAVEEEVVAQFVVLKWGRDPPKMPVPAGDLMDVRVGVNRLKAYLPTPSSAIPLAAGIELVGVEYAEELHRVESFTDNTRLALEAAAAALFVAATCLCGGIIACRRVARREQAQYTDELQQQQGKA